MRQALMDWAGARERLGAELIGARDAIGHRWRLLLSDAGHLPTCLQSLVTELILQAAAALADGHGPEAPWTRCGGLLRIEARDSDAALTRELTALWTALAEELRRICLTDEEERAASQVLSRQLESALRGAQAELANALRGEPPPDDSLRFGGARVIVWGLDPARAATRAA